MTRLEYQPRPSSSRWARTRHTISFIRRHTFFAFSLAVAAIVAATAWSVIVETSAQEAKARQRLLQRADVTRWEGRISETWRDSGWADGERVCYEFTLLAGEADAFMAAATAAHADAPVAVGAWPSQLWPVPRSHPSMRILTVYGGDEYVYVGVTLDGTRAYVARVGI